MSFEPRDYLKHIPVEAGRVSCLPSERGVARDGRQESETTVGILGETFVDFALSPQVR